MHFLPSCWLTSLRTRVGAVDCLFELLLSSICWSGYFDGQNCRMQFLYCCQSKHPDLLYILASSCVIAIYYYAVSPLMVKLDMDRQLPLKLQMARMNNH